MEDLRDAASKFGPIKDVYMPKDYYTGQRRGIAFVEFTNSRDAEDALHGLDRFYMGGKEIQATFALQGRKRPDDFRRTGLPPRSTFHFFWCTCLHGAATGSGTQPD